MKLLKRFPIAILFALLVTAATYMIAQAGTETRSPALQQEQPACSGCHSKFNDAWLLDIIRNSII